MVSIQASTMQVYLKVAVRRSGKIPNYNGYWLSLWNITRVSGMAILAKSNLQLIERKSSV